MNKKVDDINLDLSKKSLTSLPKNIPTSILNLFIENNKFTSLSLKHLTNIQVVDVSDNNITNIDNLPPNIRELSCRSNNIQVLDLSPYKKLKIVDCTDNKISKIIPNNCLESLVANHNELVVIPTFNNLTRLEVNNNIISSFGYFKKLDVFVCSNNKIKEINPEQFPNIRHLHCYSNIINKFFEYDNLKKLDAHNNNFDVLPFCKKLEHAVTDKKVYKISKRFNVNNIIKYENGVVEMIFDK